MSKTLTKQIPSIIEVLNDKYKLYHKSTRKRWLFVTYLIMPSNKTVQFLFKFQLITNRACMRLSVGKIKMADSSSTAPSINHARDDSEGADHWYDNK